MALEGAWEASLQAQHVLRYFRQTQQLVLHVQPLSEEKIIIKHFPNSFRATNLLALLQKHHITHLILCGMMTHMCIDATTRAAFDLGFLCTVVQDACATRDLEFDQQTIAAKDVQHAFLAALSNPYATILSTSTFLSQGSAYVS